MGAEIIFSTEKAEAFIRLINDGRLFSRLGYAPFLDIFRGGEIIQGFIDTGYQNFPHNLGRVPTGRIILSKSQSLVWDGTWTSTYVGVWFASPNTFYRAYYF